MTSLETKTKSKLSSWYNNGESANTPAYRSNIFSEEENDAIVRCVNWSDNNRKVRYSGVDPKHVLNDDFYVKIEDIYTALHEYLDRKSKDKK